ncbi:MAG: hypothetical protein CL947_00545 [Epsilonproteobacteria bacterium]|nr:hypothetical protein [Campylobacterota bacterium]
MSPLYSLLLVFCYMQNVHTCLLSTKDYREQRNLLADQLLRHEQDTKLHNGSEEDVLHKFVETYFQGDNYDRGMVFRSDLYTKSLYGKFYEDGTWHEIWEINVETVGWKVEDSNDDLGNKNTSDKYDPDLGSLCTHQPYLSQYRLYCWEVVNNGSKIVYIPLTAKRLEAKDQKTPLIWATVKPIQHSTTKSIEIDIGANFVKTRPDSFHTKQLAYIQAKEAEQKALGEQKVFEGEMLN